MFSVEDLSISLPSSCEFRRSHHNFETKAHSSPPYFSYLGACAGLANTHSYGELLGFRILQACGSASVIAIGSGSIGDIAPPSERGLFMSVFGLGPMLGPAIGPVVGGLLADAFGWQ